MMSGNVEEAPRTEAPISIGVGTAEGPDGRKAVRSAMGSALEELGGEPCLVVLASGTGYDLDQVAKEAASFCGSVPVIGGSMTGSPFTGSGVVAGERGRAIGALALRGPRVNAGVGRAPLGDHPRRAGEAAARAALNSAGSGKGSPRAILLFMPPGSEEQVLQGVVTVMGRGVPLWGCTVADEDVSGGWAVLFGGRADPGAVAVAALYGDFLAGSAFATGYWATAHSAVVSAVDGRMVGRLGEQDAAAVYSSWLGVEWDGLTSTERRRLAVSSPWGVEDARSRRYLVKEPGALRGSGSVGLFADVHEGDTVRLLASTPDLLIAATGAAASEAMLRASLSADLIRGVLVAQGAGRALALGDRLREVPAQVRRLTGGAPILGVSGYGEQSSLPDGRPAHLNLSLSLLVLGG